MILPSFPDVPVGGPEAGVTLPLKPDPSIPGQTEPTILPFPTSRSAECANPAEGAARVLYQRPGSLRVLRSILAVPRTAHFWTEMSDVVPGICCSHCSSLGVTAPRVPMTTGTTVVFTFQALSSSSLRPWGLIETQPLTTTLTRIRLMAATISTLLLGRVTSRLPIYCRQEGVGKIHLCFEVDPMLECFLVVQRDPQIVSVINEVFFIAARRPERSDAPTPPTQQPERRGELQQRSGELQETLCGHMQAKSDGVMRGKMCFPDFSCSQHFQHKSDTCHLQKYSNDSAVVSKALSDDLCGIWNEIKQKKES
ncbi:hypothetical protein CCH79_00013551 [Gambusia affinis]|uniref:Uncharacterized protein n=1 Tax=Gambusia affinis TaxID=33528 RepID=A0A315W021_GAMAF|nr:hypothetical protein CCH79_00013551 [Gambusia affinis]